VIGEGKLVNDEPEAVEKLCKIFEGGNDPFQTFRICPLTCAAAVYAKRSSKQSIQKGPELFPIAELDWFSKNSYNFALKYCTDWVPSNVLRMAQSCIHLIDMYPSDLTTDAENELAVRKMYCDYLCISLHISMARSEDCIETQLQHYLLLRPHCASFRTGLSTQMGTNKTAVPNLLTKLGIVLPFAFEAAVHLRDWDSLGGIIDDAAMCKDHKVYAVLADCILASEAPTAGK
jgi:hypothetical protein